MNDIRIRIIRSRSTSSRSPRNRNIPTDPNVIKSIITGFFVVLAIMLFFGALREGDVVGATLTTLTVIFALGVLNYTIWRLRF